MDIEIYHCKSWNYLPRASRVEEEMRESFPSANIKRLQSNIEGDFKVLVDGKNIYDKLNDTQTFPKIFEITKLIKELNQS